MLLKPFNQWFGCSDFQPFGFPLRQGAWIEPHHLAMQRQGWVAPIENEVLFLQHPGVRAFLHLETWLQACQAFRFRPWTCGFDAGQCLQHQFRS